MVVDLSTIHHEGGGAPASSADIGRIAHGGYTYGIGKDGWTRFRSVEDSYATLNYNHVSLDICLSGDRHTGYPVTDADINAIHGAYMDAYERGEVTQNPMVRPHKDSPGSATACPGNNTMARWQAVANAVRYTAAPPTPHPTEVIVDLASAINHDRRPVVFQVGGDKQLYMRIRDATGGNWSSWRHLSDGLKGFATVTAFENADMKPLPTIEIWVTLENGKTYHRWQTGDDRASWSDWSERTK